MLHLASKALIELLYPLTWTGIYIPVLPARLIQALDAPCPYIVGIERRYEKVELPDDEFVLVDLDQNTIESSAKPSPLPKQQRRKLISLLQLAAPHHNRFGVQPGPPAYAIEAFPFNVFSSENSSLFDSRASSTCLAKYAGLNSASFGDKESSFAPRQPVFNAFAPSRTGRPATASTTRGTSPTSSSPSDGTFPPMPTTPTSRNDSVLGLQATLREKRSGHFEATSKRSSSFGFDRRPTLRRPSIPINGHSSSLSMVSIPGTSTYAPSVYAQSTIAASTIMPQVLMQPVRNTETTQWVEGHELHWRPYDERAACAICDERADEDIFRCRGCGITCHSRCIGTIHIVCTSAFHPDQIRAAFVRCFASLFYTYRKFMQPATGEQKKAGMLHRFNMDGFLRSLPDENAEYVAMLQQTQGETIVDQSPDVQILQVGGTNVFTCQPLTNSYIFANPNLLPTPPSLFSIKSSWPKRTVAAPPFSVKRTPPFFPTHRIIYGALPLQRRLAARSLGTTEAS